MAPAEQQLAQNLCGSSPRVKAFWRFERSFPHGKTATAGIVAAGPNSSTNCVIHSCNDMHLPAAQVVLMGLIEGYRVNGGPAGESLDKLCAPAPSVLFK